MNNISASVVKINTRAFSDLQQIVQETVKKYELIFFEKCVELMKPKDLSFNCLITVKCHLKWSTLLQILA